MAAEDAWRWLRDHWQETTQYDGKWVAIDGSGVRASDPNIASLFEKVDEAQLDYQELLFSLINHRGMQ
jgi:hypothetical protein